MSILRRLRKKLWGGWDLGGREVPGEYDWGSRVELRTVRPGKRAEDSDLFNPVSSVSEGYELVPGQLPK